MQDNKPIIGVIACRRTMDGEPIQRVIERYLDGVTRHADAIAVIIPNNQPAANAAAIVARLDAVLLTGSATNIEPARYGSGLDIGGAAGEQDCVQPGHDGSCKPLFGICRGLQEINVAFGGTLLDMRGDPARAAIHHAANGASLGEMFGHSHKTAVVPDTPLAAYAKQPELLINSVHHQTVMRLGHGLIANAVAADGTIEAISAPRTTAPVFAVQWHPEWQAETRPHDLAYWHYLGQVARRIYPSQPG